MTGVGMKEAVPVHVDGMVLISATDYVGPIWGPGELNPYAQFHNLRPDAFIADGVFVFHGGFDLPLAAATSHAGIAEKLIQDGKLNEALDDCTASLKYGAIPDAFSKQQELIKRINAKESPI